MFSLHIFSLFISIGAIITADKQAFAWLRGKKEKLDPKLTHAVHITMWASLVALMATGFFMFYPMRDYLFTQPLFIMKTLFVSVLVTNGILISRLMRIATTKSFLSLSLEERIPLLTSGAISAFAWVGATLTALILFS